MSFSFNFCGMTVKEATCIGASKAVAIGCVDGPSPDDLDGKACLTILANIASSLLILSISL